jgi:hypothetical protein
VTRLLGPILAFGVLGGAAAWFAAQQGQGALVYYRCAAAGPPIGLAICLAGLVACSAAAWACWRWSRSDSHEAQVLGRVAMGAAAIFALATLASALATLVIPPCAR